jgi:FdhD protein
MKPTQRATLRVPITRFEHNRPSRIDDELVIEEPLEIWLEQGTRRKRLGITMRTPGQDDELAVGLLFAEGIIGAAKDVLATSHTPFPGDEQEFNSLRVRLRSGVQVDWQASARERVASSACGVCGRATIDDLKARAAPVRGSFTFDTRRLPGLPNALRAKQGVFSTTGGLHAAALVDAAGGIGLLREDIGRHNAVDKIVGRCLLDGALPKDRALLVSGRAGYEILQKAIRAQIPLVAAVGAPSSMAVDLARAFDVALVGFLREDRFNVYCGEQRLRWASAAPARTSRGRGSPSRR